MLPRLIRPFIALTFALSSIFAGYSYYVNQPVTRTLPPLEEDINEDVAAPATLPADAGAQAVKLPDVDAVVVIDNSGSMFGESCAQPDKSKANDPNNLRITGAQVIITSLAADLEPRATSLSLVTFGTDVTMLRPLTNLSNTDPVVREDLVNAISNPSCQGDTNIVGALREAINELRSERATPGNVPVIVFLTDGKPTTGGDFPDIERLLDAHRDIQLFAILLGNQAEKEQWRNLAAERPWVTVRELNAANELPEVYRSITLQLNQVEELRNRPSLPPGQTVELEVPPNVAQMSVTVIKETRAVLLQITDPAGADARSFPPERFRALAPGSPVETFVISRPMPGLWRFSVSDGQITLTQPEFRSAHQVRLLRPSILLPDQPVTLLAQVVDRDRPDQPLPGSFTVTGALRRLDEPESNERPFELIAQGADSIFAAEFPAGIFADQSRYLLRFVVEDPSGLLSQPTIYQLEAARMPFIQAVQIEPAPLLTAVEPILTVTLGNSDVIARAEIDIRLPDQAAIVEQLLPEVLGSGEYKRALPPFQRPGSSELRLIISGETTGGLPFQLAPDQAQPLEIGEHPDSAWMRNLALALAALAFSYLFWLSLLWLILPWLSKKRLAPCGYIRQVLIDEQGKKDPQPEVPISSLLRKAIKMNNLTIGVGRGFDFSLTPHSSWSDDNQEQPPRRLPWFERLRVWLFGPRPLARIARKGDKTLLVRVGGSEMQFDNSRKPVNLQDKQSSRPYVIEICSRSMEQEDAS